MKKMLMLFVVLILNSAGYAIVKRDKTGSLPKENVQHIVSGTVFDESGISLPGVTIKIQGAERGAVTNSEGKYSIQVNKNTEVLIFSFIGYISQKIVIGEKKVLDVKLLPDPKNALEEVSVVAFGVQKKESVIGSITTIKAGDLKIPSSNLTNSLAGRVAGIIAYQRSGEPGRDNADFFVRGITTFGNNTRPLILIDAIELSATDLARLQPDDIATFSIMKDATATALYGARGANGVILVTTKQGMAGKAKISFRAENSISTPTSNVEFADPVTYMKLANEAVATRDPLGIQLYSEEKIANTAAGRNPLIYPANDWRKMLFKDYALNQRYNLSASGGGTVARYFVSGAYNKDNGVLKVDNKNNFNNNIDLKSYTLRSNVNIDLTKSTELIVRLSGNFDDYNGPLEGGEEMYKRVVRSNPVLFPAYYPVDAQHKFVKHIMFGNYGKDNAYLNPYVDLVRGYKTESRSQMLAQLQVKQGLDSILKGLSITSMINITRTASFSYRRGYDPFYYQLAGYDSRTDEYTVSKTNDNGKEYLGFEQGRNDLMSTFDTQSLLNYNRTFGKKNAVSGLLVFLTRGSLSANAGDLQKSLPFRNLGLSGRATYAYDRRYFAEFNFGYNGSERFAETHRYGFFPSGGIAWSASNEKFFEPLKKVISNLRFRYTYGLVGNDQIGDVNDRFFYLSNVDIIKIAEMFYSDKGVPINEDKTWNTDKLTLRTATEKDQRYIRKNYTTSALNFDREPRFYANLGFDGGIWYGQGSYDDTKPASLYYVSSRKGQPDGITQPNYGSLTGYFVKKYVNYLNEQGAGANDYSVNKYPWPMIRLAQLYLWYAEALNEAGGPRPEAYQYINLVRERAGLKSVEVSWSTYSNNPSKYTSQTGLREIIHQEQLIEMAFEGQRFWDLRRWKEAVAQYRKPVQGWDIEQANPDFYYRRKVLFDQNFGNRDYFWPIKDGDILVNRNLVQNIGW